MPGSSGSSSIHPGRGTLWSDCGEDGGSTGVVNPDAVTPVARETLLNVWAVSFLVFDNISWATGTLNQFSSLQWDEVKRLLLFSV